MYQIVYEDKDVLVVHKPAGVSVHPDEHRTEGTLLQEIQEQYPTAELVHRLDKDTSGLLMVAKNAASYAYFKQLFKEQKIKKTYIALVSGVVSKDEGMIALPIARSKKDFRKRVATARKVEGARPAETHFKVLKRFQTYTLLEVSPKTGRTHQIRSHLSSIGYPVACDTLYGGKKYQCPTGLDHQFLHAAGLEFTLPPKHVVGGFTIPDGKRIHLEADLPSDLQAALETIKTQGL
ncbi:MAG: 23S rRNA pseudouridine synthase [Parcubacteria group bacterium Gr01-1014_48]|nr:MAG: 23S rRNA pseudouridine synthase [Parcubacteria group bacterium Gr01-1014_48]